MKDLNVAIEDNRPASITFKTEYKALHTGAFVKGHELVFKYQGEIHIMVVSLIERLDPGTVQITAVYNRSLPPHAEFRTS